KYPASFNGKEILPPEVESMIPLIKGEISTTHDTLFWEHEGGRAVRIGDWKMASLKGEPWELFNLSDDRTEMYDLAKEEPARVENMNALWEKWAREMKIIE
ncbi:MAG: hypothetical protein AMS26_23820, partial [Bacteroides sp. SM23_62]